MEDVGIFWGPFGIFWGPFGIFCGIWYKFFPFGMLYFVVFGIIFPVWYVVPRKIWQP
jgi:hypothetical protein